ncbi:hypothetical protein GCM10025768_23690 [Microbacterium pseudoresistens]|uniref:Antitoxin n=1 Tax=Microbacterium pseudoresistens TaxID=640634 RepID=A0A7Y9JNF9_9MICO|nr:type II toxin-antitoxin system prevent-host-death family antitoxin [Microbacterium pseudoresistens]NYD53664.1 prevent-host-death family protein [Microbacterium pseudoresistens]
MTRYSVLDARNNLSRLIADAQSGLEVVITNRGRPVVEIVPIGPPDVILNGPALAEWLDDNPLPSHLVRSTAQLDEQIAAGREAWD